MPHVDPGQKILSYSQRSEFSKIQDKKKVLVGGCFDILHYGHITFLHSAAHQGDMLVVALESDEFMRNHKKKKPVHSQLQRAEILASLGFVDYVIMLPFFKEDAEYGEMVTSILPSVIAVTQGDAYLTQKEQHAQKVGAQIAVVTPRIEDFSSSKIKA